MCNCHSIFLRIIQNRKKLTPVFLIQVVTTSNCTITNPTLADMEDHEQILETLNNLETLKRRRTTFWEKAKRYREEWQKVEAEISDTDERCHSLETEIKKKRDHVFQKLKTFICLALKLSSKDEVDSFYNSTCARYLNELRMDTITSADEAAAAQEASFAAIEEASAASAAAEEEAKVLAERIEAERRQLFEAAEAQSNATAEREAAEHRARSNAALKARVDEEAFTAVDVDEAFISVDVDEERESVAAAVDEERESVAEEEVDIERSQERIRLLTANRKYWTEQRDSFLEHLKAVGAPYEDYIAELGIPERGDHKKDEDEEDDEDEGSPNTRIQRSQEKIRVLTIQKKSALEKRNRLLNHTPVASSSSSSTSPSVSSVSTLNSRTQNSGLNEPPQKRGPGRPKKST